MAIVRNSLLLGIAIGVAGTLAAFQFTGNEKSDTPEPPTAIVQPANPALAAPAAGETAALDDAVPDDTAEYPSTYEIEDERYTLANSANGATLTSASGKKIYLDRSCLIRSDMFGNGRWEWAEYALILMFHNREYAFPSRESPVAGTACHWQGNR